MKFLFYTLLLAELLLQSNKKDFIFPPREENRYTKTTITTPIDPPKDKLFQCEIQVEGKVLAYEVGKISDVLLVLATDKSIEIDDKGVKRLEWDRKTKRFIPLRESSKIRDKIIQTFGEYLVKNTKISGLKIEPDLEEKLEKAHSLLGDKVRNTRNYNFTYIILDTDVEQDRYKDAVRIIVPIRFNGNVKEIPAVLIYDARRSGVGATLEAKTLGVKIHDIINAGVPLDMIYVSPGEYELVSLNPNIRTKQKTIQKVKIRNGFYISRDEVTQGIYEPVTGSNPSRFKGKDRPVENVSPEDAMGFFKILSKKTGKEFVLPQEIWWEVACRAGSLDNYSFGNDKSKLGESGWHSKNSKGMTHPVGKLKPNRWGLRDMHGNAAEWCINSYNRELGEHVIRGGSCSDIEYMCRTAFRSVPRKDSNNELPTGFRTVLVNP